MNPEEVLSLAGSQSEEAEVFWVSREETPVSFETNRLKQLHTRQSRSLSLRITRNGQLGFAAARGAVDPEDMVRRAVEVSQFGAKACFELPATRDPSPIDVFDSRVREVPTEKMVELGQSLIDRVRQHTPELLCEAGVVKAVTTVRLLNSRGADVSYEKSVFSMGLEGTLIRGTDMLFVGDSQSSCHPIESFQPVADTVIGQLEKARHQASAPTKSMPVIFTPMGASTALFTSLIMAFNGRMVLQGASPLGQRRGEQVFHSKFTMTDDATIPYRPASRPWDDEGMPSRKTPLAERGVVANFLYDLQTAGMAHAQSTSSGSRGWGGMPAPSISALVVEEGDVSFEDMVRDMQEGLVIEMLMGAEQGNVLGGDFSGNVLLGYKVEGGEIVGRVKDTMVSGNVYEALKNLVAIGNEGRWMGSSLKVPHLYFSALSVASKE
ncbi:MAG: TldD/PmbA family protein [Dehalococcoidia bacterium]